MKDADTLLSAIPFAGDLSPPSRDLLAQRVHRLSAGAGETLLSPGDSVSGVYFVEAGCVRVHYLDADGQEGTLYRLCPGESCILALNCLFSQMPYPAWANAEDEGASLLVLDGAAARELAQQDPQFVRALFEQASGRLFRLLATLEQVIRLPLEARLAQLLLDLADDKGEIGLPHERLASHLGTSREVVSRLLRGLVGAGLVRSGYGRITILDRAALAARCG